MKNSIRSIASILTAGFLTLAASRAHALTLEDIAGTYQGTSVATLPTGQQVTASVTILFKKNGREKVTAIVNGQTSTTKGRCQFVSDDLIVGSFPTSEFTAFADLSGDTLTLTVLAKQSSGAIVSEVTTLTKQ